MYVFIVKTVEDISLEKLLKCRSADRFTLLIYWPKLFFSNKVNYML